LLVVASVFTSLRNFANRSGADADKLSDRVPDVNPDVNPVFNPSTCSSLPSDFCVLFLAHRLPISTYPNAILRESRLLLQRGQSTQLVRVMLDARNRLTIGAVIGLLQFVEAPLVHFEDEGRLRAISADLDYRIA
jgi:hypothetical protein